MLMQRIVSAAIALPVFFFALVRGGGWWFTVVFVLTTVGTFESLRLLRRGQPPHRNSKNRLSLAIALLWAYGTVALAYVYHGHSFGGYGTIAVAAAFLLVGVAMHLRMNTVASRSTDPSLTDVVIDALLAGMYPGLFFAGFVWLRHAGVHGFLLAAIVTWATDTGAFFIGRRFGRRPLAKTISPAKTKEGAVGGLLVATVTGVAFGTWAGVGSIVSLLFLTALTSIAAQSGDLYESALKRKAGVKDSGQFLPGHGGVLDRFDSLFFAAAVVLLIVSLQ